MLVLCQKGHNNSTLSQTIPQQGTVVTQMWQLPLGQIPPGTETGMFKNKMIDAKINKSEYESNESNEETNRKKEKNIWKR